jgi:hypothetical protein
LATRIIKNLGHTFGVDISELFDSVSHELGVGHASVSFSPYAELKHTWRRSGRHVSICISDYLEDAPEDVLESLASYLIPKAFGISPPEERCERYLDFLRSRQFWQGKRSMYLSRARNLSVEPKGRWRDLKTVFDYVNSSYFGNKVRDPTLAWVAESPARRLGYYFDPLDLLVVNRVFDAERVPRYVLEFVIYHELLHHIDAESGKRTQRVHHTKSFREQECKFSSYVEAEKWLSKLVAEYRRSKK